MSRSQFYEYKRAFQERGFEGLLDRPSIPKTFPAETSEEIRAKIIKLSLTHPACGPVRISDNLRLEAIAVSPSTVSNVWIEENMETRYKRMLRLEEEKDDQDMDLTEEQIKLLEKANACFRERKVESQYPGYLLCQDTFYGRHVERHRPCLPPGSDRFVRLLFLRETVYRDASGKSLIFTLNDTRIAISASPSEILTRFYT